MNDIWENMADWLIRYETFIDKMSGTNPYIALSLKAILALTVTLIVWITVRTLLSIFEKKVKHSTFIQNNPRSFLIFRKALFIGLLLAAGIYLIRLFDITFLEKFYLAFCIIWFAAPARDFLLIALKYLDKHLDKEHTKIDDIVFDLLIRFSGFAVYVTAIILALDTVGVNVMPFIAGAGIAGVAIGFAAKDTLSNIIAGILLIIDRPFEVGDRIEVWNAPAGSATWGDVIDIGLRATKIRTTDNIVIIIPNNEIMLRDIINYTIINSKIRVRINIGIAYDANMRRAKEVILDVARSTEWVSETPPPKVVVRKFGESAVDLQLRVWIEEARRRMDTISYITDKVKDAFDEAGIEIPFPKRDIYIKRETLPS